MNLCFRSTHQPKTKNNLNFIRPFLQLWFCVFVIHLMIQKLNSRRILKFPAIQPCEGVSKDVLMASLINLGRSICDYKSKKFTTQRRNAREVIRVIGVLVIVLEEIRETKSIMSDSILLCLLEIHVAFQKIWYLLDDCSREGARLWILMKHNRVATEFRTIIRALATALDVIPMNSIDVSEEVKEFVELVEKQSQRRKFEVEFEDERVSSNVVSILNKFEKRVSPSLADLKRVLEYLGVESWSDCNCEIKFLNEEIELESSSNNRDRDRDLSLLKSLVGLMSYCRVAVFDDIVHRETWDTCRRNETNGDEFLRFLNPEDFKCPISLEIMTDPVTISTGQTYDRESIHKWLKSGNLTCPKTGEKLKSTELVQNSSLQSLIHRYCAVNGAQIAKQSKCRSRDIVRTVSGGTPAAAEAIRMLAEFLTDKLANGSGSDRNKAAHEIRLLAKSNIFNRSTLVNANAIPHLLNLLTSLDPSTQENAMAALLNLSKHPRSKSIIVEKGGLLLILVVLREGLKAESRQNAAATLFYLSSVQDYRELIGETPGAIPALVELIGEGTLRGRKNAVVTIFGLVLSPSNQGRVLRAGAVPLLMSIVGTSSSSDLRTDSLAVLAVLADAPNGALAIRNAPSGLRVLMEVLECDCSSLAKEYSVSTLLSLCRNEGSVVVSVLQKSQTLMGALYAVVAGGNSKASKKASALISLLHGFHYNQRLCDL